MKRILLKYKNKIKYNEFKNPDCETESYFIRGIGGKSIKYLLNNKGEDKWAFHDKHEGFVIGKAIIKSFENEYWNDKVRKCIEAQSKFCRENRLPRFAPSDGICWTCHQQIYADIPGELRTDYGINLEAASTQHITGCPHCSRTYCD